MVEARKGNRERDKQTDIETFEFIILVRIIKKSTHHINKTNINAPCHVDYFVCTDGNPPKGSDAHTGGNIAGADGGSLR